jgi:hypothetical protein
VSADVTVLWETLVEAIRAEFRRHGRDGALLVEADFPRREIRSPVRRVDVTKWTYLRPSDEALESWVAERVAVDYYERFAAKERGEL